MTKYAALDVSMEQTTICVVDENGKKIAEGKVPTDPDAIADWLAGKGGRLQGSGWKPVRWPCGCGTSWSRAACRSFVWMPVMRVPPSR